MDSFDIIWLIVCIGIPVLSGIVSTVQGQKKSGKQVPSGKTEILKELAKNIYREMQDDEGSKSRREEPASWPMAAKKTPVPVVRKVPVNADMTYQPQPIHGTAPLKPHDENGLADNPLPKGIDKKRIDPRQMIVYDAVLNPKFREC